METNTKTANCRARRSAQTCRNASKNGVFAAESAAVATGIAGPSARHTANTVTAMPSTATPAVTATSRGAENGSSRRPATVAVTAMPKIIMIQTMVAAAGRRAGATRAASSTRSDVPEAPTPMPTTANATTASARPASGAVPISAVASAAATAPTASAAMPPMIQGVRLLPASEPWPNRGRNTWMP